MRERDHRNRELGAEAQGEQRREQTADAEADHGRRAPGEHADREERQEKEWAVDSWLVGKRQIT